VNEFISQSSAVRARITRFSETGVQRAGSVWGMLTQRRREGVEEGKEGKEGEEGEEAEEVEEKEEEKQMLLPQGGGKGSRGEPPALRMEARFRCALAPEKSGG
jgi:hypothetical protein